MRTELHCHTTASDGLYPPAEIVRLARLSGVTLIAITDHDTIAGNDEAATAGSAHGVRVIPGIEVSALSRHAETHVLGYGVRPSDAATLARIATLRGVRESRARSILDKLTRFGIHIPFEQVRALAGDAMIGRPHIARAMVMAGVVQSEQEAFALYLAEGKPAFTPHEGLTPAQAVQLIHDAGGLAVLAHPGLYAGDLSALLDEIIPAGLDGIEVFYPLHTPEQTARFAELAHRHHLLLTGGSDFHGPRGDAAQSLGGVHLPPEHVEALLARLEG
ncbi:MAG: PHP-like protein [Candidatus Roseilinea sp.]|nr:MAG: PHP-like protein [Candidatus Roseilinea sp.]